MAASLSKFRAILCLLTASAVLAGCSPSGPESAENGDPWAAELAVARQNATSDFERQALADGKISQTEYDEAYQRWLDCMRQAFPPETSGFQITLVRQDSGAYETEVGPFSDAKPAPKDLETTTESCRRGTTMVVAGLYTSMKINPENRPLLQLIVDCLKRHEIVPQTYTTENLQADQTRDAEGTTESIVHADGTIEERHLPPPQVDQSLVTDLDLADPQVRKCHESPQL
jgi:hypothetical protein